MNKHIGIVAAAVLLAAALAGAYYLGTLDGSTVMAPTPTPSPSGSAAPRTDPGVLTWNFVAESSQEPADGAAPRTKVTLTAEGRRTYDLGVHDGNCFVIETSAWKLLEGERTGAICWWAGGGTELGVFQEGGKWVVKAGPIEEGTAETTGVRGNLKTLLEVK